MEEQYIDLHTHTTYSDGSCSPEEVIKKAKEYGLEAIAITDHDTVEAYNEEIFELAKSIGIELVTGIEFSTKDENNNKYHIVGLLIDLGNEELNIVIKNLKQGRKNEANEMFNLLEEQGYKVNRERFFKNINTVTKLHIAKEIVDNVENNSLLEKELGNNKSNGSFIEKIMNNLSIKNPKKYLTPLDAINIIHEAKGLALLAHPSFYIAKGENIGGLCEKFLNLGIDGFEAVSVIYDRSDNDKEYQHIKELTNFCIKNSLIITGGSDFHVKEDKKIGKLIDVGFKNHKFKVPYSVLEGLKEYKKNLYN